MHTFFCPLVYSVFARNGKWPDASLTSGCKLVGLSFGSSRQRSKFDSLLEYNEKQIYRSHGWGVTKVGYYTINCYYKKNFNHLDTVLVGFTKVGNVPLPVYLPHQADTLWNWNTDQSDKPDSLNLPPWAFINEHDLPQQFLHLSDGTWGEVERILELIVFTGSLGRHDEVVVGGTVLVLLVAVVARSQTREHRKE